MYTTNLLNFNTMHISAESKGIIPIYSERGLYEVLVKGNKPLKIIGGGSNILLVGDIDAYILKNEIKGIHIVDEDEDEVLVSIGAGENWHNFVMWTISQNLGGIENLALIPGSVGAAPIQNIGAYGVEQRDSFHSLKAIDLTQGISKLFFREDCQFGYRDSIFKKEAKGKCFITHVNYILSKKPMLNMQYGAIIKMLEESKINTPTIADVADAIIKIRTLKLPDPKIVPNTGSFFKNPVIEKKDFEKLKQSYPNVPNYVVDADHTKIPAAWLIEKAGFKGKRVGDAGTHKNHALVLVNYGKATGKEILEFANDIQIAVSQKFEIDIVPEVNIWES
ncbi:MAG: UDP-N-acetylmuramate dehydrogenase [Saprospiraceae bacterium]